MNIAVEYRKSEFRLGVQPTGYAEHWRYLPLLGAPVPMNAPTPQALSRELREAMEALHGPLLGGKDLFKALGFASAAALRQARRRGHVAVPLFTLPKQRGLYALTRDVADWLGEARARPPAVEEGAPPKR